MFDITDQDYDTLTKLRWLQLNELAIKYSNDQEFGAEVRKLIKKWIMEFKNLVANDEFGMDYDQLGNNEQEWVIDYIDICLSWKSY